MDVLPARVIRFERCYNFRDLGGYAGLDGRPVRWRRLFRSMTPQHMTAADAVAVRALNIGLVLDFRGERFPHSGPVPFEGGRRIPLSPSPMQRDSEEWARYRVAPGSEALPLLLERYGKQYGVAFTAIAERPDTSALFHCRLGKDRTGVFAAVLLKLLGVDDRDVTGDYMMTAHDYALSRRLLDELEPEENHANEPKHVQEPPTLGAIEGVLQALEDRYGGAYAYLRSLGVSAALIDAFVESALEPAADGSQRPLAGDPVPG